ncbi:uncharacterized protein MYCFIDRAFT_203838 [Pseudocercospora fijiensis CIRAD86]|uniref:Uncharacterized protein n=1 Tax=Pseudocercospora fijiensis (strain CIRAD86) TaxID=383855 RepID=M2YVZ4_PSEFD|nr:uncharacterized protein MYCFIDRAFT_203838 [Pseudocercospora fijiensis CIRAD86]EME81880.1 hypothetical protein MYCFIDRAFT_203838 [Pseudocercospora fijiensis CIRAD86]
MHRLCNGKTKSPVVEVEHLFRLLWAVHIYMLDQSLPVLSRKSWQTTHLSRESGLGCPCPPCKSQKPCDGDPMLDARTVPDTSAIDTGHHEFADCHVRPPRNSDGILRPETRRAAVLRASPHELHGHFMVLCRSVA